MASGRARRARAWGAARALMRRAGVTLAALALVAGQWLGTFGGALAPTAAYAADGYDYTFPSTGKTVHVSGDGSTVTGECEITDSKWDKSLSHWVAQTVMPDGSSGWTTCYESHVDPVNGHWYSGPGNGTYSFTATRTSDSTYEVVVDATVATEDFNGRSAYVSDDDSYNRANIPNWDELPSSVQAEMKSRHSWIQRAYVPSWTATFKVDVTFSKCSADAKVTAGNSEYAYAGAEYDIYRASDDAKVAHVTTASDGKASYKLDAKLTYYAVETKAPAGFKLDAERHYFSTDSWDSSETLSDDPGVVRLTISKKDSATLGEAQAGATLEGAEYRVTSLSTPGWETTVTTNAKGVGYAVRVPLGTIQVVETKAPTGYKLDATVRTYEVKAGQITDAGTYELEPEDDFAEDVVAFDLEVAKTKGGEDWWEAGDGQATPAAGVQFQVISNTTGQVVGTLTTNASGFASTKDASTVNAGATSDDATYDATKPWFGAGRRTAGIDGAIPYDEAGYTVHEVESTVPDGYDHVDDWQVTADQMANGSTKQYSVIDKTLNSRIQVVKADAETGSAVPLAGFSFQVIDASGKVVSMDDPYKAGATVDTFTTDGEGQVTLPSRLAAGTYKVREVAAASPYVLAEDVEFTVSSKYAATAPLTLVTVSDSQAKGKATITKTCSEDGSALEGAEYDVIAQADVTSPDGTVRATKGQVVDHVITGADGKATTKELYLGSGSATYAFVETKSPEGHVLDATPVEFTLTYKDQATELVTAEVAQADAPTELDVDKTILGTDEKLGGAEFAVWAVDDQVSVGGGSSMAVRAEGAKSVTAKAECSWSRVNVSVPDGYSVSLVGDDATYEVVGDGVDVEPGTYQVKVGKGDEAVDAGDVEVTAEAGRSYEVKVSESIFGTKATATETGDVYADVELIYDADEDVWAATGLDAGTYDVKVDGKDAGSVEVTTKRCAYASVEGGELSVQPILLKGGAEPTAITTDDEGHAEARHLTKGSYRMRETEAPKGFVESGETYAFTVDERGMTEGVKAYTQKVADDYTKVRLSKRDVTNEAAVEGAKLTVRDSEGNVVESWVSTKEDHVINALAPGDYTLTEEMTPHSYDKANTVEFTVEKTGEVQSVVMYDEPIEVSGDVDKRQEIADPTHEYTEADGDGQNKAQTTVSEDGSYDYSVDFRSTSSTWVDEFTVEDDIAAATDGTATLESVTTPQAWQDYDGKVNVWYKTNETPADYVDPSGANATTSDGHENPWLTDESTADALGDDSRAIDYTGWRLWAADASATESTELKVSDLGLADGEVVVAVRFEYGRVESGFTTREGGWDRDDLKDAHDDVDDVDATASSNGAYGGEGGATGTLAPAVFHMQVTDDYREGTTLDNFARVDLYRNGGDTADGGKLEDHDTDKVTQTPKERLPEIGTTLTDDEDGDHVATASGKVGLTDTISLKGLEAGVEHVATGTLMDKAAGEPVRDADGNEVTATTTFTPEEADGTVEVRFEFDATKLDGHDVVAFETVTVKGREANAETGELEEVDRVVAEHKDIDDLNQTVRLATQASTLPQTGLEAARNLALAGGFALAALATEVLTRRLS